MSIKKENYNEAIIFFLEKYVKKKQYFIFRHEQNYQPK